MAFELATLPAQIEDQEWPTATVAFHSPGLLATAEVSFYPGDLQAFVHALASAYKALNGKPKLEAEDGDFLLKAEFSRGGDVLVTGHIKPSSGNESILTYQLDTDQSYLGITLRGLQALLL